MVAFNCVELPVQTELGVAVATTCVNALTPIVIVSVLLHAPVAE
jgi:hypothetical protein